MSAYARSQNTRITALAHATTAIDRVADLPGINAFDRLALMRLLQLHVYDRLIRLTKEDDAARAARSPTKRNTP